MLMQLTKAPTSWISGTSRLIAVAVVVWALTPGFVEVVENSAHVFVAGHLAHVESDDHDHRSTDDEHGCTGPYHVCSCHSDSPFTGEIAGASPGAARCVDRLPLATFSSAYDCPPSFVDRPPSVLTSV